MNRFEMARICVEGASNPRRVAMALVEAIDECRKEGGDDASVKEDVAVVLILDQLVQLLGGVDAGKFSRAYDEVYRKQDDGSIEVRCAGRVVVGDRVRFAVQNYDRIGTVVEIEHGCYPTVWVQFDDAEFRSGLCAMDICREDWLRGGN